MTVAGLAAEVPRSLSGRQQLVRGRHCTGHTCCCLHWADPALFIETAAHAFGCSTENEFETEGPLVFGVITFSENGPILAPTTLYESKQTVGYMAIKYSWLALSGNSI